MSRFIVFSCVFGFLSVLNAGKGPHRYVGFDRLEGWELVQKTEDGYSLFRKNHEDDTRVNDFLLTNASGVHFFTRLSFIGGDSLSLDTQFTPAQGIPEFIVERFKGQLPSCVFKPWRGSGKPEECLISVIPDKQNPGQGIGVLLFKDEEVRFYPDGRCFCLQKRVFPFWDSEEPFEEAASVASFTRTDEEILKASSGNSASGECKIQENRSEEKKRVISESSVKRVDDGRKKNSGALLAGKEKPLPSEQKDNNGSMGAATSGGNDSPKHILEKQLPMALQSEDSSVSGNSTFKEMPQERKAVMEIHDSSASLRSSSALMKLPCSVKLDDEALHRDNGGDFPSVYSRQNLNIIGVSNRPDVASRENGFTQSHAKSNSWNFGVNGASLRDDFPTSIGEDPVPIVERGGKLFGLVDMRRTFVRSDELPVDMRLENMASNTDEAIVLSNERKSTNVPDGSTFTLQEPTHFVLERWFYTMICLPKEMVAPDRVECIFNGSFFK